MKMRGSLSEASPSPSPWSGRGHGIAARIFVGAEPAANLWPHFLMSKSSSFSALSLTRKRISFSTLSLTRERVGVRVVPAACRHAVSIP